MRLALRTTATIAAAAALVGAAALLPSWLREIAWALARACGIAVAACAGFVWLSMRGTR